MFNQITGCEGLSQWMSVHNLTAASVDLDTFNIVNAIKVGVQANGDAALCDYTQQFDNVNLESDQLKLSLSDIKAAYDEVDDAIIAALKNAAANIKEYHLKQRPSSWEDQTSERTYGVQYRPISAVGLYVPGGRAAYPSSVLMTAIPAAIAGCQRIVMVSPPTGGKIPPIVLVAADLAGVTEVIQVGGAQAVFALAYGTQTIQPVDKIVGPGNRFVTAAKQMVYGTVDIDKPAGPSEVCVYIDSNDYSAYAAAEMWAQLEHDPDASAICICANEAIANSVNQHAQNQLPTLSRQDILNQSKQKGIIVLVSSRDQALQCINQAASEHLVLLSQQSQALRKDVQHAGSIFCGPYTPVTLGDYYAGPNHVLPTARSARFASPLGVMDFVKYSSYLEYSKTALKAAASDIDYITRAEGFDAHNNAVKVRLGDDKN
ncbi:MAG: histidinol dehydrogenase [Candidatus Margulisiibacteriota bacterium]